MSLWWLTYREAGRIIVLPGYIDYSGTQIAGVAEVSVDRKTRKI